jgi:RNA polymerase sigma-70 factor (ECF subfamily)
LSKIEFKTLVEQYSRLVLNVALRILGNADLAHDVHQEVFLAVWRTWNSFQDGTNWRGYLYRVTVRKSIEFARKSKVIPITEWQKDCSKSQDHPEAAILTKELWHKVTDSLANLPEKQAEVFVLSRIEGLEYKDIAEAMNCSEATIRVHLHRAMVRMARELKNYLAGHGERTIKCMKK